MEETYKYSQREILRETGGFREDEATLLKGSKKQDKGQQAKATECETVLGNVFTTKVGQILEQVVHKGWKYLEFD